MRVVRRRQQQSSRVQRAARHHHHRTRVPHRLAIGGGGHDCGHGRARRVGLEPLDAGVGHEHDVGVLERRPHRGHLGVGLALDEAGEAIDAVAADARAGPEGRAVLVLVEHHAERQVGRVQTELLEVVVQLLDPRFVHDGRERELAAAGSVGRVLALPAVHGVHLLGLRVPRLEVVVPERPCGRDATVVGDLPEVLGPQAEQRRTVELGVATDVVVLFGRELLTAVTVDPALVRQVLALDEHSLGLPVVALTGEVVAALDQQDAQPGWRERVRESPTSRAGPDDDDVVVGHCTHGSLRCRVR